MLHLPVLLNKENIYQLQFLPSGEASQRITQWDPGREVKRTIKMKMTILMVINMAMRIVCNKDEEDDSDGESKYSEE